MGVRISEHRRHPPNHWPAPSLHSRSVQNSMPGQIRLDRVVQLKTPLPPLAALEQSVRAIATWPVKTSLTVSSTTCEDGNRRSGCWLNAGQGLNRISNPHTCHASRRSPADCPQNSFDCLVVRDLPGKRLK